MHREKQYDNSTLTSKVEAEEDKFKVRFEALNEQETSLNDETSIIITMVLYSSIYGSHEGRIYF